jgi:hypothetical protein
MRATGGQMIDLGGFSTDSTNSGSILDGTDPFFLTLGSIAPDAINGFYCVMESDFFDNQSGEIDDLFDASPFKNNLATPGTRPDYSAANALAGGMPAFDFGTAANGDIFTAAKSGTYKEIIIAGAYKEGLDTAFDDEIVITTNAAGGNRISGASASAELNSGGFASSVSINGAAVTATLLPTGFSVLRFTGASAITGLQNFFGEPSQPTRSWQGPVGLLLTSKRDLSTDEFSGILGAIQDKFSIA